MKAQANRLKKLERNGGPIKRQFIAWIGDPWTKEQMAEQIRLHPRQRIFWRSLLEAYPLVSEEAKRKEDPGDPAAAPRADQPPRALTTCPPDSPPPGDRD